MRTGSARRGGWHRRIAPFAFLLLLVWGGGMVDAAHGQAFGRVEETESNVAYFYHAKPGAATVQISVWGTVPRAGIYEVPDTTDLDKLLTMAGGAPLKARREDQDESKITVRVYRPGESARSGKAEQNKIFEARLKKMLQENPTYPALQDDDIVVVETVRPKESIGFREILSIASSVGSLTLLALRLFTRV